MSHDKGAINPRSVLIMSCGVTWKENNDKRVT